MRKIATVAVALFTLLPLSFAQQIPQIQFEAKQVSVRVETLTPAEFNALFQAQRELDEQKALFQELDVKLKDLKHKIAAAHNLDLGYSSGGGGTSASWYPVYSEQIDFTADSRFIVVRETEEQPKIISAPAKGKAR